MGPGHYRARARFRDFDGRTRLVEASGTSRGKAEAELLDRLRSRARPSLEDLTGTTRVGVVADLWMAELKDSDLAASTQEKYRHLVDKHVRAALGNVRLQELTVGLLDRHLQAVREKKAGGGAATAKMLRTVLIGILGVAVRHDALQVNLAKQTRGVALKTKPVVALTVDEVHRLRRAVASDAAAVRADLPDLVDLMLATGCRINEALALRWTEVDLKNDEPTVHIGATLTWHRGAGLAIQEHPKSAAGQRTLILAPFAVEMLLRRSVNQQPNSANVVFPSSAGTLRDSHNVSRQWRAFQQRDPRWSAVTSHTFRKTVATVLSRQFDALTASAQLGHSSSAVTEKHYIARAHRGPDVRETLSAFAADQGQSDG
ncbi:site-specific integrase [Cellulomonas carbonis]|uniref:site-specific integrase n=1 Tax=Cellulomonas carbonis TaxID=1386092 RepID=UPI0006938DD7|nr:site-specific integrase [Cellulomonas carbonis]